MLSDSQRRCFDDDGYLVVPRVFHVDELAWLGGEARSVTHGHGAPSASAWSSDEAPAGSFIDLHLRQDSFRRLAIHPRLRALASDLAGKPVQLLRTRLFPGARAGDPIWRRDAEIWRRTHLHDGSNAITAAIVLDGHYAERPAFHVLPGSHRDGAARPPLHLKATLGSVILLHCATRYALHQPGSRTARPAFLVTYDAVATRDAEPAHERNATLPPPASDASLWPVPIWIAG